MADSNMQLQWTDDQWNKVRQVVYEEARRARVAGNFLPLYGPLGPDATYVTQQAVIDPNDANDQGDTVSGFTVADTSVLKLTTLQVKVYLKGAQVADPELTSALIAFRRAANIVARLEDEIIFVGQSSDRKRRAVMNTIERGDLRIPNNNLGEIIGGEPTDGLLAPQSGGLPAPKTRYVLHFDPTTNSLATNGEALVGAVSKAIAHLEERHHLGPFACVLGHQYFTDAQTPERNSMVLPQDRILPFLGGGALLRTSTLPDDVGLVIALGGEPIDLVVSKDISVKFLQATTDPWFVFRVYEKLVLRVKQPEAIAVLSLLTAAKAAAAKAKAVNAKAANAAAHAKAASAAANAAVKAAKAKGAAPEAASTAAAAIEAAAAQAAVAQAAATEATAAQAAATQAAAAEVAAKAAPAKAPGAKAAPAKTPGAKAAPAEVPGAKAAPAEAAAAKGFKERQRKPRRKT